MFLVDKLDVLKENTNIVVIVVFEDTSEYYIFLIIYKLIKFIKIISNLNYNLLKTFKSIFISFKRIIILF